MFLATTALLTFSALCAPASSPVPVADDLQGWESLYRQGITFDAFMETAERRRERWVDNHAKGHVPAELLERAEAVPGEWRLLVVAEDWCSDSVNIVPYLDHLVEAVDGLEMRIVDSEIGRPVMEAHPTPDGRPSTPTIVLLNEAYDEVGCFIERPSELRDWALEHRSDMSDEEFLREKFAWYDADLGRQSMSEIIDLMEAAAAGATGC